MKKKRIKINYYLLLILEPKFGQSTIPAIGLPTQIKARGIEKRSVKNQQFYQIKNF